MAGGFQKCAKHQTARWEGIFQYCMILNNDLRGNYMLCSQLQLAKLQLNLQFIRFCPKVAQHKHSIEDKEAGDDLPEGLLVKGADLVVHAGVPLLVNGHPPLPLVPDIRAGHGGVGVVGQSVLIRRPSQPGRPCCKQPWVHLHRHRTDTDAAASLSCRLCIRDTVIDKILHK